MSTSASSQPPSITISQTIRENTGKVIGAIINLPDPNKERLDEARATLIDSVRRQWSEVPAAPRLHIR